MSLALCTGFPFNKLPVKLPRSSGGAGGQGGQGGRIVVVLVIDRHHFQNINQGELSNSTCSQDIAHMCSVE